MNEKLSNYLNYQQYFNPAELWDKIAKVAKKAGIKVVYAVMLLFYVATDPSTSATDKAKIYGALGYFILPLDIIPDLTPMVGYTDDMAALVLALRAVWDNITDETREKAQSKLVEWFGEFKDSDIKIF